MFNTQQPHLLPETAQSARHTWETARSTTQNISGIALDASRRFYLLQIEAAEQALHENTQHLRGLLQNSTGLAQMLAQWPDLLQSKFQRYADLTRDCFNIASETITEMNRLSGKTVGSATETVETAANEVANFVERRVSSQLINFPDRRKASSPQALAQRGMPAEHHREQLRSAG